MASETICDICCNKGQIFDCVFTVDIILELLDVVFTNNVKELGKTSDPNVCKICLEKIHETFIFKSKCIYIEDLLTPYKETFNFDLNLKHTAQNEKIFPFIEQFDVDKVCRLCFTPITNKKINLDNAKMKYKFEQVLEQNLSELNLELVKESYICELCLNSLQKYRNLIQMYEQSRIIIKEIKNEPETKSVLPRSRQNDKYRNPAPKKPDKVSCPDCSIQLSKCSLSRHQKQRHSIVDKKFPCDKCHYSGVDAKALKSHMLVHKTDNECEWFLCKVCSYKSKYNNKLQRHMLMHQDTPPKYNCEICGYRTHYKENLKRHMIKHDDNAEMVKCNQCDYKTRNKRYMKYHRLIHEEPSKVKKYKCSICSYETVHLGNLIQQHMLTHGKVEKKFYHCDRCDFKTYYKAHYKNHDKVHKDFNEVDCYKCSSCSFITKYKSSLVNHVANHLKNS